MDPHYKQHNFVFVSFLTFTESFVQIRSKRSFEKRQKLKLSNLSNIFWEPTTVTNTKGGKGSSKC